MTDLDAIRARDAMTFTAAAMGVGTPTECARDRRALLAEVDRLTALDYNGQWLAGYDAGIKREGDRIRAAVEGMFHGNYSWAEVTWDEALPAVLAAIDAETP